MYENIGGKIKGLAKATFVIEAVAAFIGGIVLIEADDDLLAVGLLAWIMGPLLAWVSSWLLYGFGELIEKVCNIERYMRPPMAEVNQAPVAEQPCNFVTVDESTLPEVAPMKTDANYVYLNCPNCNNSIFLPKDAKVGCCPYCNNAMKIKN